MDDFLVNIMLSGRGLCVGPITHPEEFSECGVSDRKTSTKRGPFPTRCNGATKKYCTSPSNSEDPVCVNSFYPHTLSCLYSNVNSEALLCA
jgi:hypothetical protein